MTKALTAIDPHNAELEAARAAGIPIEPWQQVIADAAVGRLLVGVAGTHGKSTTAGWLVHVLVRGGPRPVGVRRGAAAGLDHGWAAVDGPVRQRQALRRRGGRIRGQLRSIPAGRGRSDLRRVGPPRRVRGPRRRRRKLRRLAGEGRRVGGRASPRRQRRRRGRRGGGRGDQARRLARPAAVRRHRWPAGRLGPARRRLRPGRGVPAGPVQRRSFSAA